MKKVIAFLLVGCIMMLLCSCGRTSATVEGPGFDSPEEAALAYANALKKGDVNGILAVFAIETYVEKYDLEEYLDYVRAFFITNGILGIDSDDSYTMGISLIERQYQITKNLTYLYLTLGELNNFTAPITLNGKPYNDASDFMNDLVIDNWMDMMAEMEINDVLEAGELPVDVNAGLVDTLERQEKYLNCDELVAMAVEITIDGDDYYLCVDVACYDGKWYNCTPMGMLSVLLGEAATCGGLVARES